MVSAAEALKQYQELNDGYCQDFNAPEYKIAHSFVKNYLKIPDDLFEPKYCALYLKNNHLLEKRGVNNYLRPSMCVKFTLKSIVPMFYSEEFGKDFKYMYAYHGTVPKPEVIQSIIKNGLRAGGSKIEGKEIQGTGHGAKFGKAMYCTRVPLVAELYAGAIKF